MTKPIQPESVELLPCPFCGGEAKRVTLGPDDGPDNVGGDVICCIRCQASSHVEFGRKENLVDRWNTRIASTTPTDATAVEDEREWRA
jgi:Lar family restriction alleviation protein